MVIGKLYMNWLFIIGGIYLVGYIVSKYSESKKSTNVLQYTPSSTAPYVSQRKLNEEKVDLSNIKLSTEQQNLFGILEDTNKNIFITGKAGTGKSLLLQYFKQKSKKRLVVTAPTGVAALNVGGQTIHSLFRIPPEFLHPSKSIRLDYKTIFLLKNIDTVVIDEISMVRADLMDAIDRVLRQARGYNIPFGGVQMVLFGDPYQLPPVVSDPELHKYFADNHGGYYFFNAHVWKDTQLEIHELTNIFRQKDEKFKDILNAIRVGDVTDDLLFTLNNRVVEIPETGIITLSTTNASVAEINHRELEKLPGEIHEYRALVTGNLEYSAFPTDEILKLKKGAQVMLIKNDKNKRWVNGTIGVIESLSDNEVKVNIDGITYSVPKETWSKILYYYNQVEKKVEEEVVSSFTQFPLKLAWAVTIHKSQGQTYGTVAVDMGNGAFAHGQTYVALSRCTNLEGLYLKRQIVREDIMVDPIIINFMEKSF